MKKILKKNLKKVVFNLTLIIVLLISMCFSSYIDKGIVNILSNKNHIIANDKLLVHFIDVGQADAVAINFPNGKIALIDTGSLYSANELIKYLDAYVMPFSNGEIEYLFFSHADSDHTGGIRSILFNYEVNNIVRPRQYASFESLTSEYDAYFEDEDYDATMLQVYEEVNSGANLIKAEDLLHYEVGGVIIDIFYPKIKAINSNNFSYFIKVEYNGTSLLFTGDANEKLESELVKEYADKIECDILKVAHHGSSNSTSSLFLQAVTPKYAVISVGKNNYGHPSSKVINNLQNIGVEKILRTDLQGNILFSIDNNIEINLGEYYISKIEFKYIQLSWCFVFILICYATYWIVVDIKAMFKSKIKHN